MNEAMTDERVMVGAAAMTLHELETPCLVLDAARMERNVARLREIGRASCRERV